MLLMIGVGCSDGCSAYAAVSLRPVTDGQTSARAEGRRIISQLIAELNSIKYVQEN